MSIIVMSYKFKTHCVVPLVLLIVLTKYIQLLLLFL